MPNDRGTSPNHNLELIEGALLEAAVRRHPTRLTPHELAMEVVWNPDDESEVQATGKAIRGLRHYGLLRYRTQEKVVEPTPAGRHAVSLLTR